MPEYITVYEYDIASIVHFVWLFALFAILGPIVAAVGISKYRKGGWRLKVAAMLLWGTSATLAGGFGLAVVLWRHVEAVRAHQTPGYEVIEGPVRVLRTQPAGGHAAGDLISIAGREIEIDFFGEIGPGYRQTIAHGGVLQADRQVRLYVRDGKILRVDVAR